EFKNTIDFKKLNTYHTIIYAKNQSGIKKLYEIISDSHINSFYKKPRIKKSMIMKYRDDLIVGSACESGLLVREILSGKSEEELKDIVEFYDYLEIQPIDNNRFLIKNGSLQSEDDLRELNRKIVRLGEIYEKPVVATCDVHFLDPYMSIYRKVLLKGLGYSDSDDDIPLYFRTTEEMLKEFSYLGDEKSYEVVVTNSRLIADMIDFVKPIPDETYTPKIPGAEEEIRNIAISNVSRIYGENLPDVIKKRLDKELNSIINHGYAVLYLIAHKLVKKSYSDGYLVGSRGSVGSSFVATMCGITEVNGLPPHYICPKCKNSEFILDGSVASGVDLPDKICPKCGTQYKKDGFDIPFETFLGFDGDKEPDIDLNFSGEYQPVVHKYTEELFGKGYVFRAGTIGSIADKTAYGFSKKYFEDKGIKASNAEVERLAQGCNGVKRTTGQHPGGIMVVPNDNDIHNFTPIQHPADDADSSVITTHFDYHSISGRLLKLDILGHDDPTILRMLQDLTGIDPKSIPLADSKVLSLFTSTEALGITKEELGCELGCLGIPEFGTKFVRQMLLETKPKTFSDLVRISGLSHGTDVWINNAQYFIKEGFTTLKDCIATRDGIMVYLLYKGLEPKTSFTIMEKVRKGKGLSEDDEKILKEHDVPDWYIESCKRIKYMFPLGHAVAYVMMAVRIAYFKVYYPLAYYATYFSVRSADFDAELIVKGEGTMKNKMDEINKLGNNATAKDKNLFTILEICYEMYKRGFRFLKVDLYKSHRSKFLIDGNSLIPPFSSLQGVGENAAKGIMEARDMGEFLSIEDLKMRAKLTKTAIETLYNHGSLNNLSERNQLSLF
ncbi:MAG: PolC-type DNA polymerase III, partial [Oscillospiraceae bacterium]|nr:PolC-type DNA polymerase III [Oscillospiraceae bacterium]